jgi:hypothetical protein
MKVIPIATFPSGRIGALTIKVMSTGRPVRLDGVVIGRN